MFRLIFDYSHVCFKRTPKEAKRLSVFGFYFVIKGTLPIVFIFLYLPWSSLWFVVQGAAAAAFEFRDEFF